MLIRNGDYSHDDHEGEDIVSIGVCPEAEYAGGYSHEISSEEFYAGPTMYILDEAGKVRYSLSVER